MKKFLVLLMAVLMVLSVVPMASAEDATITFAFWDTNQEPGMRAIADAYEAAHPGVKVVTQVTPWSEYWTKLEAAAMGGEMPDVYWMHSNQFFKYADAGIMLDLSDLDIDYSVYPEGITALYNFDGTQLAGRHLDVGHPARSCEAPDRYRKGHLRLRRAERHAVRLPEFHLSERRLRV